MIDEPRSAEDREPLDKTIWGFEAAWAEARVAGRPGPDPAIFFVATPADSRDRELVMGLASVDMETRLMLGEMARVEEYLGRFPGVEFESDDVRELIRVEYVGRLFQGQDDPCDTYGLRFPGVFDQELLDNLRRLRADPANDPHVPRYRIVSPHRRGGVGWVYLAYDRELRRRVALKEIADENDSLAVERSRREAEIAADLDHPGIVTIHSSAQWSDGRPYYVMRFVAGPTLSQEIYRLHHDRPPASGLAPAELKALLARLVAACQALAHAHHRRVAHLDLKPGNILLGYFGETVIIDWGSSQRFDQLGNSDVPSGTPAYMSPEQAENNISIISARTDIFNIGASLYHLLTGRAPFQAISSTRVEYEGRSVAEENDSRGAAEARKRACAGVFQAPRQLVPSIPRALEAVCLKAMAQAPRKRYASALELIEDLAFWLAGDPVSAWREPWWARAWPGWCDTHERSPRQPPQYWLRSSWALPERSLTSDRLIKKRRESRQHWPGRNCSVLAPKSVGPDG